jgi:hypothetical protein
MRQALPSGHAARHDGGVTDTDSAYVTSPTRGRGLVIAGAILLGLYLLPVLAILVLTLRYLIYVMRGVEEGGEGIFLIMVFYSLVLLAPLWFVGIALLGAGRSNQRGPVRGAIAVWILAVCGLPVSAVLIAVAMWALCGDASCRAPFYSALTIAFVGIAVLTPIVVASVAWLIWGRPRTA